jgi:hypothetical protein
MKVTTALDQCVVDVDTRLCTRTARRRTAPKRRARLRWRRSRRVGGGNQRRGASRAGNSATVASPGPAPKTIIALSSGWLAIRPRWIVHRCYSGPWRPRRGRHHRDLDRPRELFVMLRQVRAVAPTSIQNDSGLPQGLSRAWGAHSVRRSAQALE